MISQSGLPIKNNVKKKSRPSLLGRLLLWMLLGASIFIGFGLLARISSLQVSTGTYENIIVTSTDDISAKLDIYLEERYLYPRSNKLWFSNKKAETFIMQEFPRIGFADVSLRDGVIHVYGDEREGVYLWCGKEVVSVTLDGLCYFGDETGFIFDTAPYFSGASYRRLYGGTVSENIIGSQAYNINIFEIAEAFENVLQNFDLGIQAIYMREQDQLELILLSNNEMPEAPRLKHYIPNDLSVVTENLSKALEEEKVLLDIVSQYDRLDYLDTRFKNQVLYKFFDETVPPEQPEIIENNEEISEETIEPISETETEVSDSSEG